MTDYSIIVPAYNEEARLEATLAEIGDYIAAQDMSAEIIVVDDGSTDGTVALARSWTGPYPVKVIESPQNRGKGHAVRTGMLAAEGAKRVFTDADGSTPIDELAALDRALESVGGRGVAIASVAVEGAQVLSPQSRLRVLGGRVGNRLIQLLVLPGVRDSQRGFKLFTADVAMEVFTGAEVDGWAFDVEALALARHAGFPVVEVPVRWEHRLASRVKASSYLTTLWEVWRIRRRIGRALPVVSSQ
ncbi:MAG: glycosyltransferase family 2 protein [bacterium]|nr:glycosyltransferase family 2 protein [bacterium]